MKYKVEVCNEIAVFRQDTLKQRNVKIIDWSEEDAGK